MADLLNQFPDKEAFDTFFKENYKPIQYDSVRADMEALVKEEGLNIFHDEYAKSGKITKEDFTNHLSQGARFTFQDAMSEAFYDTNPDIYEAAFGLYELAPEKSAKITSTFHEVYAEVYQACLECLFDEMIAPLL